MSQVVSSTVVLKDGSLLHESLPRSALRRKISVKADIEVDAASSQVITTNFPYIEA
jgi:hypothetical protein